jgi:uncharacterized protein YqeY
MTEQLADTIYADMTAAMRSGDTTKRDALRMLRSAIRNKEIDLRRPATDDEIQAVVLSQIKQRREAAELYRKGGREDLAAREDAEVDAMLGYAPEQLSEDELRRLVTDTASELNATGPGDMRRLMPALMAATAGRADGSLLSRLAGEELKRRANMGETT